MERNPFRFPFSNTGFVAAADAFVHLLVIHLASIHLELDSSVQVQHWPSAVPKLRHTIEGITLQPQQKQFDQNYYSSFISDLNSGTACSKAACREAHHFINIICCDGAVLNGSSGSCNWSWKLGHPEASTHESMLTALDMVSTSRFLCFMIRDNWS